MVMVGQTQIRIGQHRHGAQPMHSQQTDFSGWILMRMDLEMCQWVQSATIVLKLEELQQKTSKAVLILTAMVGQTNTVAGRLQLQQ